MQPCEHLNSSFEGASGQPGRFQLFHYIEKPLAASLKLSTAHNYTLAEEKQCFIPGHSAEGSRRLSARRKPGASLKAFQALQLHHQSIFPE